MIVFQQYFLYIEVKEARTEEWRKTYIPLSKNVEDRTAYEAAFSSPMRLLPC